MAVSIRSGPKPAGTLNEHRELRASRWGGSFGPRGSASRRNSTNKSAQTTTKGSAQFCRVRAARSPGGPKAQRASPAALRAAEAQHFSVGFVLGARPPRAAKASPSPRPAILRIALLALGPKTGQQFSLTHRPKPSPMLGPARRENRNRFSRPKNEHAPKLALVLRPMSASLRLRCRSATFAVARRDFISILLTAK